MSEWRELGPLRLRVSCIKYILMINSNLCMSYLIPSTYMTCPSRMLARFNCLIKVGLSSAEFRHHSGCRTDTIVTVKVDDPRAVRNFHQWRIQPWFKVWIHLWIVFNSDYYIFLDGHRGDARESDSVEISKFTRVNDATERFKIWIRFETRFSVEAP